MSRPFTHDDDPRKVLFTASGLERLLGLVCLAMGFWVGVAYSAPAEYVGVYFAAVAGMVYGNQRTRYAARTARSVAPPVGEASLTE